MERLMTSKPTEQNLAEFLPPTPSPSRLPGSDAGGSERIFGPLLHSSRGFYAFVGSLCFLVAMGAYAYYIQLQDGLGATGMRNQVQWGLYISNFVFFIGISHAGTLISAVLRVSNAEWRRPITRMAESITVMALMIGALFPLIDLGRPDRVLNLIIYGRLQSPIVWDFISIATYITGSIIYLYLPLIPDIAECRDRLGETSRVKRWIYRTLSAGWQGTARQKKTLQKCIGIMAILIIPIAVSVHTVVSWIFAMTLRVGWHSTIYGPYFVVGAIFSGLATLIIAMGFFRRIYHLENYLTFKHFKYLAYLLFTLDIALLYFTLSEYITVAYGGETADAVWLNALFFGQYSTLFWSMFLVGFILPATIIAIPRTRTILWILIAAVLADIGMWIERYLIVVPTLATPQISGSFGSYLPTWVEATITIGAIAGFVLLYTLFSKIFPIVSSWELAEAGVKPGMIAEKEV
jgi:Ni/Fe-hydrogenase subunit HybB-like protein